MLGMDATYNVFWKLPEAFVVGEEEDPVLDDRSADGDAELVAVQGGLHVAGGLEDSRPR